MTTIATAEQPKAIETLPTSWFPLRPHRLQSILWRTEQRRVVVAAGRGSGKTELALRRLALYGMAIKGTMQFYGGPTVNQAKRIAWGKLLSLIHPKLVASINQTDLIIKLRNQSEIHVCGMDKPHRIEGSQWDGGVLDEGSDQKPGAYAKSVYPALTHKNGWLWRIGVPKRTGVGAREFKAAFDEGQLEVTSFSWPSSTVLPPEVILQAQKELDEKTFNEQFNASWETAEGLIYHAFSKAHNVRKCDYNPKKRICVGSDFNVNPMSWCLSHTYDGEHIQDSYGETFDEIRLRDTNTPATLEYLYNKYRDHEGGWSFYGDAASKARKTNAAITDFQLIMQDERFDSEDYRKRKRVMYPSKNPMLKDRFAASNSMFANALGTRRWFVDPKCKSLIDDLNTRAYAPGSSDPDDADDQGHMADALDYLIYAEFPVGWDRIDLDAPAAVKT